MKWEYKTIEFKQRSFLSGNFSFDELNNKCNSLGRDGWELVQTSQPRSAAFGQSMLLIFKRAMQ